MTALPLAREQRLEVRVEVVVEEVGELGAAVAILAVPQGAHRLLEVDQILVGALQVALARDERFARERRRGLRRTLLGQQARRRPAVVHDDAGREDETGAGGERAKRCAAHAISPARRSRATGSRDTCAAAARASGDRGARAASRRGRRFPASPGRAAARACARPAASRAWPARACRPRARARSRRARARRGSSSRMRRPDRRPVSGAAGPGDSRPIDSRFRASSSSCCASASRFSRTWSSPAVSSFAAAFSAKPR